MPRSRLTIVLGLVLVLVAWSLPVSPASATSHRFPVFTGVEFRDFYYARLPTLPGTSPITQRPHIYGDGPADDRIQQLAEGRGYRLQATPTVALRTHGGAVLADDAGQAWLALASAARDNGTPLQAHSGYRSVDDQRSIFIRELDEEGRRRIGRPYTTSEIADGTADAAIDSVLAFHSIPGYSRHHTGKSIDISHQGGSLGTFANSAAYRWISTDNYAVAKRFGLIPNYPPNAGAQGPEPEPWEFSYVGEEAIRCAIRYISLEDPQARQICGGGVDDLAYVTTGGDGTLTWHLRRPGVAIRYGSEGNTPIAGDWNGDGTDDLAFIRTHDRTLTWHLRIPGRPEATIPYGSQGDMPIAGDWNGDGTDDLAFVHDRDGTLTWHLRGAGTLPYGSTGDIPITGDWNGDGTDDLAFIRTHDGTLTWHLRTPGRPEATIPYGSQGDTPIAGDWNGR